VAIELRLVAPIRFQSLLPLKLGIHFHSVSQDGARVVYLSLPGHLVKNKVPLEFELPQETVNLLHLYVQRYLPVLSAKGDGMLFPGSIAGHKCYAGLADQVRNAVSRYGGLNVSMHAFRHIAAKLHLLQRPHDYLPVSLLLGHLSVETTMKYYCELERPSVARQYGRDVLGRTFHSLR
jgi:integrase